MYNSRMNSNISPADDYEGYNRRGKSNKKKQVTLNAVRVPANFRKNV